MLSDGRVSMPVYRPQKMCLCLGPGAANVSSIGFSRPHPFFVYPLHKVTALFESYARQTMWIPAHGIT